MRELRRKAKRIWAFLLVLLLLFSVAGGSSFPVLAETEGAKSVSVEAGEAKEIEKAEKQAEEAKEAEKAEKQDRQEEEQQEDTEQVEPGQTGHDEGEETGAEQGKDAKNPQEDDGNASPDKNTGITENGEVGTEEEPKVTDPEQQPTDSAAESGADAANAEKPAENETETEKQTGEVLPKEESVPEEILPAEPVVLDLAAVEPEAPSLAHRKYADRRADGTYDLTLEFTGKVDTDSQDRKLDVLLIVDESGSMTYSMGGDKETNYTNSRWYNAKLAIQQLIDTLEKNDGLDVHYSIVTYSGSENDGTWNDAQTRVDWSPAAEFSISGNLTNPQERYSAGDGRLDYKPSGGTNYQAGLRTGAEQLKSKSARSDAEKVVLFLSDGKPTFYYDKNGETAGSGDEDADEDWWGNKYNWGSCSSAAYAQADKMTGIHYFYAIGIGRDENAINPDTLKELSVRIGEKNAGCKVTENNAPYLCGSLEELKKAFSEMAGEITRLSCKNVTVTDTLSENVDLLNKDGKPLTNVSELVYTLSAVNAEGGEESIPEGTTVVYDPATRGLRLKFPDGYELGDGWTYQITVHIAPSELAYSKYFEADETYPDRAEPDTGTHADGWGFYSNVEDSAKLIYTWNDTVPREEEFPMPVVKLDGVDIPVPTGLDFSGQLGSGVWAALLGTATMAALAYLAYRRRRYDGTR